MKFLNSKGFTLAEIMVAGGIAGLLALVISQTINTGKNDIQKLDNLANKNIVESYATSLMSNAQICQDNFANNAAFTPAVGATVPFTQIIKKARTASAASNAVILQVGSVLGDSTISGHGFKITGMNLYRSATTRIELQISYTSYYQVKGSTNATTSTTSKVETFKLPIDAYFDSVTGRIGSCKFNNVDYIIKAVKQACNGGDNSATDTIMYYIGPGATDAYGNSGGIYGKCLLQAEMSASSATGVVAPTGVTTGNDFTLTCPPGQLLAAVSTTSSLTAPKGGKNRLVLQCMPFTTTDADANLTCPADSYLQYVDSTGTWQCKTLASLWSGSSANSNNVLVRKTDGTYAIVDISCSDPVNYAFQTINPATLAVVCQKRNINAQCGAGQYLVGMDVNQNPVCKSLNPAGATCTGTDVINSIDSSGNATCVSRTWPKNSCSSTGQVLYGWNSAGTASCSAICP